MKLRVGEELFDVPDPSEFSLGELSEIRRLAEREVDDLNINDPRVLVALAYATVRRVRPTTKLEDITSLTMGQLEWIDDEPAATPTNGSSPSESVEEPSTSVTAAEPHGAP